MNNQNHSVSHTSSSKSTACRFCILLTACFWFLPQVLALDPPPDGGYPNQTTAEGEDALFSETTGTENTALGYHALYSQSGRHVNTGVGANVLAANTAGYGNTAVGADALSASTYTNNNTAMGLSALAGDFYVGDSDNVAIGYRAMALASSYSCVAIGSEALVLNQGQLNTAVGKDSLTVNTTGEQNTALGWRSLFNNVTGNNNTVSGLQAMFFNQSGSGNVALGQFALGNNTTGNNNIALGTGAGRNITVGHNNITIGNSGEASDFDVIRIGAAQHHATVIAGIVNSSLPVGLPVIINREGRLGVATSSSRFKDSIEPMAKSSEAILSLKPVTFHYKKELDPDAIPQFGLVAEDVARVDPDLIARDAEGKPYTVRYEAVNAMLLNEFLKAHQKVEEQASKIEQLETRLEQMAARLDAKGL